MSNFINFRYLEVYPTWVDALRILTFQFQKQASFKGALKIQNSDFLENGSNDSDSVSVTCGDHLSK
jgi:hypothetical protein